MSDNKRLFITPAQCTRLLGVCRASIYNYFAANSIPCYQFKGKTLISRESLNTLFDGSYHYLLRPAKEIQPITEFYTTKEDITVVVHGNRDTGALWNDAFRIYNLVSKENISTQDCICEARYPLFEHFLPSHQIF